MEGELSVNTVKEMWKHYWTTREYANYNPESNFVSHDELQLAVIAAASFVHQLSCMIICHFFNHNLRDDSCIGPDSGTETITCTRCGWSWSHTYY
jgi:hypothetical protein